MNPLCWPQWPLTSQTSWPASRGSSQPTTSLWGGRDLSSIVTHLSNSSAQPEQLLCTAQNCLDFLRLSGEKGGSDPGVLEVVDEGLVAAVELPITSGASLEAVADNPTIPVPWQAQVPGLS